MKLRHRLYCMIFGRLPQAVIDERYGPPVVVTLPDEIPDDPTEGLELEYEWKRRKA